MKHKIFKILIFAFCFLFASIGSAFAIGIGSNFSSLDLELKVKQAKKVKVLVYNISQEAGIFKVFPEQLQDWITIEPNNFRLEAGENKEIEIKVSAKKTGERTINLAIAANPLERQSFSISPGLKIPLRLNAKEKESFFLASVFTFLPQNLTWLIVGMMAVAILTIILGIKYRKLK